MTFLYPFTISISRPNEATPTVGDRGYSALGADKETVVHAGPLLCSIQEGPNQRSSADLPGEPRLPNFKLYVPRSQGLAQDAVKRGDIVTDNRGWRFQVEAPIWTSLGMEMRALFLEP